MPVRFADLLEAFEVACTGPPGEVLAYLNRETGEVIFHSDYYDGSDPLPDDIDEGHYIELPHQNDLGLGRRLALAFAGEHLPDDFDRVVSMFRRKGAYARFKDLLAVRGKLDDWYGYQSEAAERALREWCRENGIEIEG